MLTRAAKLETELKFLDAESEKAAELKKIQLMKQLATSQAQIEAVAKLDENHEFDLAVEANLLEPVVSPHERVLAYLENQTNAGNSPVAMETQTNAGNAPVVMETQTNAGHAPVAMETQTNAVHPPVAMETQTNAVHPPVAVETELSSPKVDCPSTQVLPAVPEQRKLNPETNPFVPTPPATDQRTTNSIANRNPDSIPVVPSRDYGHNTSDPGTVQQPSPDANVLTQLVDLLGKRNSHDSLPRPEPEVFDGNLLRYPTWIKSFETFIERKTSDPSERLFYLGRFTSGEAKEAVSGLLPLNTEQAYTKAKKILTCRFGNPFLVSNAYRRKIDDWPKIAANDGASLRKFSDFLQHCCTAMGQIQYLSVLDDPEENQKILKKLPSYIVNRWSRIVDKSTKDDPEESLDEESVETTITLSTYPTFKDFCRFLKTEARIACHPVTSQQQIRGEGTSIANKRKGTAKPGGIGTKCFATGSNEKQESRQRSEQSVQTNEQEIVKPKPKCIYCKEEHELDACKKFLEISIPNRRAFVISKRLCWGCLKWGHNNRSCRRKKSCRTCGEVHPTALHGDKREPNHNKPAETPQQKEGPKPDQESKTQQTSLSNCIEVHDIKDTKGELVSHSLIVPVWIHHSSNSERKILTYALLDDQSDACFIKDSTLNELEIDGPEVELELSTVLAQSKIKSKKITGLVVRGMKEI